MAMNEEKKAAPPRQRRPTKLGLDADDRRNDASNMVHRTDGRRHDFAPGERVPKVGRKPNLMARERRPRAIVEASFAERQALSYALGHGSILDAGARNGLAMAVQATDRKPDDFWARVEQTPIVPGPVNAWCYPC